MILNHLNLTVTDVRETQQFLQKYFGLSDGGGNANMGFLRDDNGMGNRSHPGLTNWSSRGGRNWRNHRHVVSAADYA